MITIIIIIIIIIIIEIATTEQKLDTSNTPGKYIENLDQIVLMSVPLIVTNSVVWGRIIALLPSIS